MTRLFAILALVTGFLLPAALPAQPGMPPLGGHRSKGRPGPQGLRMLERLNAMPAEERRRVLSELPPKRRAELEKGLERYQKLKPEDRENLSRRFRSFQQLSPDERQAMREAFRRMNELPNDRRRALHRELLELRQMPSETRQSHVASGEFKEKFSPEEREIMENLARGIPGDPQ